MENQTQKQEVKRSKPKTKGAAKCASVRIHATAKKRASELLDEANDKEFGRSVKLPELFDLALSLVTAEHIHQLQDRSATNEDRKEHLRQIYTKNFGPISKDEFTGFMMTTEFQKFISEHGSFSEGCNFVVSSVA